MDATSLDFWIKNHFNVLFVGKHGVGKTARVAEAFNKNNLKWLYFSASTLDPWVDFIGVPKEVTDPQTGLVHLDLIRPKVWAEDNVEAIFVDEYNRAPKKVRNAVMELIQFKSINGKPFKNLKAVWAAINPDDESDDTTATYDVEVLDPAQKDRFHVIVDIPYEADREYFKTHYQEAGENAVDWWEALDKKGKDAISPRRLEYALQMWKAGGQIRDVLSQAKGANITKLTQELKNGSFKKNLYKVFNSGNKAEAAKFIKNPNNYDNCIEEIVHNKNMLELFAEFIDEEKCTALAAKHKEFLEFIDEQLEKGKQKALATNVVTNNPDLIKKKDLTTPSLPDF